MLANQKLVLNQFCCFWATKQIYSNCDRRRRRRRRLLQQHQLPLRNNSSWHLIFFFFGKKIIVFKVDSLSLSLSLSKLPCLSVRANLTNTQLANSWPGPNVINMLCYAEMKPTDWKVQVMCPLGWEPWSSGYVRRLMFQKLWVRIPAPYTGWTSHFSHVFVVKIVWFVWKDQKINKKRPGLAHF